MIQTDQELYHTLGVEESILWKMTILHKTIYGFSAISIKSPMVFFIELEQKNCNLYGNTKELEWLEKSWERKIKLEAWDALTLDYTIKLQSSKQYGTDTETEI